MWVSEGRQAALQLVATPTIPEYQPQTLTSLQSKCRMAHRPGRGEGSEFSQDLGKQL